MRMFNMDLEDFQKSANVIKEEVLNALERDGLLKKPVAEIGNQYAVVIAEPAWFGKLFQKLKGDKRDAVRIFVMKDV